MRASPDQVILPQPCPLASRHRVAGGSSQQADTLSNSPPYLNPLHTAPTWTSVARGDDRTQREAPPPQTTSPADANDLYRRCAALGFQTRFSVKNKAAYEEVSFVCRFPSPSATSNPPARPIPIGHCQHRRNRQQLRGKPSTHSASVQTEPLDCALRPHSPESPPPPVQADSPTAPPLVKKMPKCHCQLELLRHNDADLVSPLFISCLPYGHLHHL
jgi:hypothetical protein